MIPIWETGQEGGRSRPMDRAVLLGIAREVVGVFGRLGIRYCLSHGTALGVVRQGDAIEYDDDCDLSIFSEDRPKLRQARQDLRGLGFYVPDEGDPARPVDPLSNMPWYDFVAIKGGEKVECWVFDRIGDFWVYDPLREGLAIPEAHLSTFDSAPWRGEPFNVPHDPEGYLALMYGDDWRVPQEGRKYNHLRAPPGQK